MGSHLRIGSFVSGIGACLVVFCLLAHSAPAESLAETNATANPTNQAAAILAAQLKLLEQLQAQQASTLEMFQQSRLENAASLATLTSNNLVHLNAMSEMLAGQRAQDMRVLRNSTRVVLAVLAGLTGLLLVSILFLNMTSTRAINQLVKMLQSTTLVPTNALPPHNPRQLLLLPEEKGQPPLSAALAQLNQRIQAIEQVALKSQPAGVQQTVEALASQKASSGKVPV